MLYRPEIFRFTLLGALLMTFNEGIRDFLVTANPVSLGSSDRISSLGQDSPSWLEGSLDGKQAVLDAADSAEKWKNWNTPPEQDSTGNLIFSSVSGLLQHWHNTRYRNGHTVVPGIIQTGTLLYHGRFDSTPPAEPDWLSFDFEHAYMFCGSECRLLTYAAARPLKVLYFDGSSAAKMEGGPLDSQEIIRHGKVGKIDWGGMGDEIYRIRDLCKWGEQYGLDGFVRMEFDFEVMYCDFTNGLRLVSNLQLIRPIDDRGPRYPPPLPSPVPGEPHPTGIPRIPPPLPPPRGPTFPPAPAGWLGSLRPFKSAGVEAIQAGAWHNHHPGLNGVKLDYSRLITFLDPRYQSLLQARKGLPPQEYRLAKISTEDAALFAADLGEVLTRSGEGSGVEWGGVFRSLVERYSQRLEYLDYILTSSGASGAPANGTNVATRVRQHVLMMLSPYILWSAVPTNAGPDNWANTTWLSETMHHCSTSFTSSVDLSTLTRQERVLHMALEATAHEICRTLGIIWVDAFAVESAEPSEAQRLINRWTAEVKTLMAWLDWSDWVRCSPACSPDMLCTLPQWPFAGEMGGRNDTDPFCIAREYAGVFPPSSEL